MALAALLWLFLLSHATSGWAQQYDAPGRPCEDFLIDTWELEDGLPENSATSMVQTADGYLWFGTFEGLVRFDGVRFDVLTPRNTPGLPGDGVVTLHLDRRGRLLVSTLTGLAVREGSAWRTLGAEEGWTGDVVRSFAERADGTVLASSFDSQFLELRGDRFTELPPPPGAVTPALCASDGEGGWWVTTPGFVSRWDGSRWTTIDAFSPEQEGLGCCASRDGGVWVITGRTLTKYKNGVVISRKEIADLPPGVWEMYEDSRGNLWISTHDAGVHRVSPDGSVCRWDAESGLAYDGVRFVFEDRQRNLWIGTSGGGLARFKQRRVLGLGTSHGIAERIVKTVAPAASGSMFVGTYGNGAFDVSLRAARPISHPEDAEPPKYVQSVLEDSKGRRWIGGFGRGLFVIDGAEHHWIPSTQTGGSNVIALMEDSGARVWISGGDSVVLAELDGEGVFEQRGVWPIEAVCAFAEDGLGAIVASNRRGVFRLTLAGAEEILDPDGNAIESVVCIRPLADGSIWMGTEGAGLLRWQADRLDAIELREDVAIESVYGIIEDDDGIWWMATNHGVARVPRAVLEDAIDSGTEFVRCLALGMEDGMPTIGCTGGRHPVCARDRDGRLWFATLKGLAVVDPRAFAVDLIPPPVHIERLASSDPTRRDGEAERVEHAGAALTAEAVVPAGHRRVEIRYAGLDFANPEGVRYEIMLEGLDASWRDMRTERSIVYDNLLPGRYVFKVRACNADGVWNDRHTSVAFRLLPSFWQTWWFRAALGLVLVWGLVAGVWWVSHLRSRQRRRAAEQFRLVVEASPSSIVLIDAGRRIRLVNTQAEREFGYAREEMVGHPVEMLFPDRFRNVRVPAQAGDDEHRAESNADRGTEGGREAIGRRKNGSEFSIEITLSHLESPHGRSTLASIENISSRKASEREMLRQRDELAHLSRVAVLGELSGSIAHELNQPLTAILSNSQAAQSLLEQQPIDRAEMREILNEIVAEDKRAGEIISGLRSLLGKRPTQADTLDVVRLAESVLRLLRSDLIARDTSIELVAEQGMPNVQGDRVQLQQVLLNLIVNGCEAVCDLPPQRRRLELRIARTGCDIQVSVRDSGSGIPDEVAARLFEPFLSTKDQGMGLGLSICRTIVEAHGGRIWAANNATSDGATFSFTLPVRSNAAGAERTSTAGIPD